MDHRSWAEAGFDGMPLPTWVLAAGGRITRVNALAAACFPNLHSGELLSSLFSSMDDRNRLAHALATLANDHTRSLRGITTCPASADEQPLTGELLLRRSVGPDGGCLIAATFVEHPQQASTDRPCACMQGSANDAAVTRPDFLSSLGHELRTPLNAIVGFSELLQMQAPAASATNTTDRLKWITGLSVAARHLIAMADDLIDHQAVATGRIRVQCTEVPLATLLDEAVEMLRHRFEKNGVSVVIDHLREAAHIHADPARIKQVILNLLDNAAKYTPRGGSVRISVEAKGQGFRIGVRDDGPGLSATQQAGLFMPFKRLGAERTGVPGFGLGLSISHQLVQRMGGQIGCDSALGHGSSFWCWMPATSGVALPPA